ncbi:MAG: hypothetical protein K2N51_12250 [Lachnospiraceae bacterium]|nr:hypothetical protein [Lachnospiraceae bacterium]
MKSIKKESSIPQYLYTLEGVIHHTQFNALSEDKKKELKFVGGNNSEH